MPQNLRPMSKTLSTPKPVEANSDPKYAAPKPVDDTPAEMANPIPVEDRPKLAEEVAKVNCVDVHEQKQLRPVRTEYFRNDLTEDDKEALIGLMVGQAKAALSEGFVTVNTVARMLGIEHSKAKQSCAVNDSLKNFLDTREQSKTVARMTRMASKLTPEERELLMNQLDSMAKKSV